LSDDVQTAAQATRTATGNYEGLLDMEATSHDDLLDAFRLSVQF